MGLRPDAGTPQGHLLYESTTLATTCGASQGRPPGTPAWDPAASVPLLISLGSFVPQWPPFNHHKAPGYLTAFHQVRVPRSGQRAPGPRDTRYGPHLGLHIPLGVPGPLTFPRTICPAHPATGCNPSRPRPCHKALPSFLSLQHFRVWLVFSFNPFIFVLLSLMLIFLSTFELFSILFFFNAVE